MVCNVFDLNLNPLGTVFSWISLVWDEYYNALGEAQLELAYTKDNAALVKANRYLSLDGSAHLMLIESVEIQKNRLIAYAKDALNILDKRVTLNGVIFDNCEFTKFYSSGAVLNDVVFDGTQFAEEYLRARLAQKK